MTKVLTIPGYGGYDGKHWQSIWESRLQNIERVEQNDWDDPDLQLWISTLNDYIKRCSGKCVLVGLSLSCALIAHWTNNYDSNNVIGALLVPVSDADSPENTPDEVRSFSPMPTSLLPIKSIVVATENDPYLPLERAKFFAKSWEVNL